jgi:hypothetical protein
MRLCALVLAALAAFAPSRPRAQTAPPSDVLDRVAAVVGDEVITQSQVDLLVQIGVINAASKPGQPAMKLDLKQAREPKLRQSILDHLVAQSLIYAEAQRLAFQRVRPEEVEEALKQFRSKFDNPETFEKFLAENDITEDDLRRIFTRTILTERFRRDSVRLSVQVLPSEAQDYYTKYKDLKIFKECPKDCKEPSCCTPMSKDQGLRRAWAIIYSQREERASQAWIASLRKRQNVQVLLNYQ